MKRKKGFDISATERHGYAFIVISFGACKGSSDNTYEWVGKLEFQASIGTMNFYGGHVTVDNGDLFMMEQMTKILKDLDKNVSRWDSNFQDVISYVKKNYHRLVFDDRVQKLIRCKDRLPLDLKRYMLRLNGSCYMDTISKDKESAKKDLIKQAKESLPNTVKRFKDELEEWLEKPFAELDQSTFENKPAKPVDEIINENLNI